MIPIHKPDPYIRNGKGQTYFFRLHKEHPWIPYIDSYGFMWTGHVYWSWRLVVYRMILPIICFFEGTGIKEDFQKSVHFRIFKWVAPPGCGNIFNGKPY